MKNFHIGNADNVGIVVMVDDAPIFAVSWLTDEDGAQASLEVVAHRLEGCLSGGQAVPRLQRSLLNWFAGSGIYAAEDVDARRMRETGFMPAGVFDPHADTFDSDTVVAIDPDSIQELAMSMDLMMPCEL